MIPANIKHLYFKLWHKPTKTLQCAATVDYNNAIVDTYGSRDYPEPIHGLPFDECIFLRYTQLHDKNGKAIYEGDILDYPTGFKRTVSYQAGMFVSTEMGCVPLYYINTKAEVVGNIYENPELVND